MDEGSCMTADHDEMENLVAAYALDACADEEERARVAAHLVACPSCRAEPRRRPQAVDALPLAVDPVRPPDRLKARILAAAAASPQGPASDVDDPPTARILKLPTRPERRPDRARRRRLPRLPMQW